MLQPQQVLQNRYQLKSLLSKNAARQTWLATDLKRVENIENDVDNTDANNLENNQNAQVVVKLLAFGGDVEWEDLKLFEREAQILKQIQLEQIPQYIDYFSLDDRVLWFALVEEYIPGHSFKELLENSHRFTEAQVKQIAIETLNILIYLHELNPPILHRDIKPSNLIWGEDEHVYLVDFGAVQDKAAKEGVTFTVVGTYGYAPIEQFGGKAVPASDLYALGTTLIHLLTGISPADLPIRDMRIQFQDKVSISSNFEYWLVKMTEPSVEKRFKTARQALQSLQENRASRISGRVALPIYSRIIVQKTSDILAIKIPNPNSSGLGNIGSTVSFSILCFFVFLFILFFLSVFGLLIGTVLLVLTIMLGYTMLLSYFGYQRIVLTAELFEIQLWLFKWCISRKQGENASIQDVFQSVIQTNAKNSFQVNNLEGQEMVTIQTDTNRYSFGVGLSAMECLWVAQEIKDWVRSH